MDKRTGRLYMEEEVVRGFLKDMIAKHFTTIVPTQMQLNRRPPRVGRNDLCPCKSGKKFKYCCYTGGGR